MKHALYRSEIHKKMIVMPNEVYKNIVKSTPTDISSLFTCPKNISERASKGIMVIKEKLNDISIDNQECSNK